MFEPQVQSIGINMYNLGLNCSFPALTQKHTQQEKKKLQTPINKKRCFKRQCQEREIIAGGGARL